jgi:hypothetical protein
MDVRVPDVTANGMPYVVEVGGDIDIVTAPDLEEPVIEAIRVVARDNVARLMALMSLDKVIAVVPSRAEAEGILGLGS